MEVSGDKDKILKPADVTIKTVDGSMLQGKVNLGAERRVSDIFTKSNNPFVVLFDAAYAGGTGKVLVINKSQIVWIEPEGE
jgi:hypothetical protein